MSRYAGCGRLAIGKRIMMLMKEDITVAHSDLQNGTVFGVDDANGSICNLVHWSKVLTRDFKQLP